MHGLSIYLYIGFTGYQKQAKDHGHEPMKKPNIRRWMWQVLKFTIVAAIFIFLYTTGQLEPARLRQVCIRPEMFATAAVLIFLGTLISVERWRVLLRAQNVYLSFGMAVKLCFVGFYFSTAIPGAVSGDIVKAYYLAKGKEQKAMLVMSVILDRFLGMYTIFLTATLAILVAITQTKVFGQQGIWTQPLVKALGAFTCISFFLITLMGIVFMNQRLRRSRFVEYILTKVPFRKTVTNVYNAIHDYGQNRKTVFNVILLSMLSQVFIYAGIFFFCMLLKIEMSTPVNYMIVLPLCLLINAIPLAPGGLGVGEVGFQGIFLLFGSDKGAEVAILFHIFYFVFALGLGGLVYLFSDLSNVKTKSV